MATMQETVNEALEATKGQPVEVQAAAVQAVLQPDLASVNWLWKRWCPGSSSSSSFPWVALSGLS